jgi:hypothetical protein
VCFLVVTALKKRKAEQQQGHTFNDAPATGFGNPLVSHREAAVVGQPPEVWEVDDIDNDRRSKQAANAAAWRRKKKWQKQDAVDYRQYDGEGTHFNLGLSLEEIEEALNCMLPWDSYTRDKSRFLDKDGKCWNNGKINGYDLGEAVRDFLRANGFEHLSIAEVLWSEGRAGAAEATVFFSHIQQLPVKTALRTLKEASKEYDKQMGVSPKFFIDYLCIRQAQKGDFDLPKVRKAIHTTPLLLVELDDAQGGTGNAAPEYFNRSFCVFEVFAAVESSTSTTKPLREERDLDNAVLALNRELSSEDGGISSPEWKNLTKELKRRRPEWKNLTKDQVGEALVRARQMAEEQDGEQKVLVWGPAVKNPKTAPWLFAQVNKHGNNIVNSREGQCRWPAEKKKIDAFIESNVGYGEVDKLVGAVVASACNRGQADRRHDNLALAFAANTGFDKLWGNSRKAVAQTKMKLARNAKAKAEGDCHGCGQCCYCR